MSAGVLLTGCENLIQMRQNIVISARWRCFFIWRKILVYHSAHVLRGLLVHLGCMSEFIGFAYPGFFVVGDKMRNVLILLCFYMLFTNNCFGATKPEVTNCGLGICVNPNDPSYGVPDNWRNPEQGPNEGVGGVTCSPVNCAYYDATDTNTSNCADNKFTNYCYVVNGETYVVSSCSGCNSDSTLMDTTLYISGCANLLTIKYCKQNEVPSDPDDECNGKCDNCVSYSSLVDGWFSETIAECDTDTCTCHRISRNFCAAGFYGSGALDVSGGHACYECPPPGTSIEGSKKITACFVPSGYSGSDDTGTWVYERACTYTE